MCLVQRNPLQPVEESTTPKVTQRHSNEKAGVSVGASAFFYSPSFDPGRWPITMSPVQSRSTLIQAGDPSFPG